MRRRRPLRRRRAVLAGGILAVALAFPLAAAVTGQPARGQQPSIGPSVHHGGNPPLTAPTRWVMRIRA